MYKIGIYDSGSGGLNILDRLQKIVKNSLITCIIDKKYAPYGNKEKEIIKSRVEKILTIFQQKQTDLIISACNTSLVTIGCDLNSLTNIKNVTILDGIKNLSFNNLTKILIFATSATVNSKIYSKIIHKKNQNIEVMEIALPELATMIDLKYSKSDILNYLTPIIKTINFDDIDGIIYGCTHYPVIDSIFQEIIIRKNLKFINPADELINLIEKINDKENIYSLNDNIIEIIDDLD